MINTPRDLATVLLLSAAIAGLATLWSWFSKRASIRLERVHAEDGDYGYFRFIFDSAENNPTRTHVGKYATEVLYFANTDKFSIIELGLHRLPREDILKALHSEKYGLPPAHPIRVRNSDIRAHILKHPASFVKNKQQH